MRSCNWLVALALSALGAPKCRRDGDAGCQGGVERADSSSFSLCGMLGCTQARPWLKGETGCIIAYRCNTALLGSELSACTLNCP